MRGYETEYLARWLVPNPNLPEGVPQDVARACADLGELMVEILPNGPEKSAGLRKLLEAKDCFVRAGLE